MILEAKTSPPPRTIPESKVNSQGRGLPLPSPSPLGRRAGF